MRLAREACSWCAQLAAADGLHACSVRMCQLSAAKIWFKSAKTQTAACKAYKTCMQGLLTAFTSAQHTLGWRADELNSIHKRSTSP